jgi:hypothetical protein
VGNWWNVAAETSRNGASLFLYQSMQPSLFVLNGVAPLGRYLLAVYAWSYDVTLTGATLTCRPPSAGTLTVALEVNGVLTGETFTVGAAVAAEVVQDLGLNRIAKAGQNVRWLVTSSGTPEGEAMTVSVSMTQAPAGVVQASVPRSVLTVNWINGPERGKVFDYDSASHVFMPTSLAWGRCEIAQGDVLSVKLLGTEALRVKTQAIACNEFFAIGSTVLSESPRLEFMVDNVRVAALGMSGVFRVSEIDEDAPAVLMPTDDGFYSRFELYSGGILTATLGVGGLTALEVDEPIS